LFITEIEMIAVAVNDAFVEVVTVVIDVEVGEDDESEKIVGFKKRMYDTCLQLAPGLDFISKHLGFRELRLSNKYSLRLVLWQCSKISTPSPALTMTDRTWSLQECVLSLNLIEQKLLSLLTALWSFGLFAQSVVVR
jgi:hypothetical protein